MLNMNASGRRLTGTVVSTLLLLYVVIGSSGLMTAQLPMAPSTQFDITGFIQSATLDPGGAGDAHAGGAITVNNHSIVVPRETIVILPANALTWEELFAQAPA